MRRSQTAALILFAIFCIAAASRLWPKAFPTAAIDFRVSRTEAAASLTRIVESLGRATKGYYTAASFGEDDEPKRFIELEYGIPKLEQVTRAGVNVWYWTVRWFKPEQHEEFSASLDPQGRFVGYARTIEEERELPYLDKAGARAAAEAFIRKHATQHPLEKLRFVSDSTDEKPHRTDYTFTWERDDFRLGDAPYRVVATIQGNEIGSYFEYLKVPDDWLRGYAKKRAVNDLCMSIASYALMAILAGAVVLLIIAIKNHRVRWRDSLPWGWFVLYGAAGLLAAANSIPELLASYPTTENWDAFIGQNIFATLRSALLGIGGIWLLALLADAIYREKLPGHLGFRRALGPVGLRDPRTVRSLFIGVIAATGSVAYVSAFYVAGKHWGVWAPVDIDYAKTLSGWFPWVSAIQVGLSAAFGEELLFRIIGFLLFWKILRVRWLAVLLSSATWGFLHSNYPQMPGYARGIELTIVGIVWCVLLIRYGVVTTLTAHYLYDCWLGSFVVFQSPSWADRAGAFAVSGWPVALFAVSWHLCRAAGNEPLLPEAEDAPHVPPPVTHIPPAWSFAPIQLSAAGKLIVLAASLAILALCYPMATPQASLRRLGSLDLPHDRIADAADQVLRDRGFDPSTYRRIVTPYAGATATKYLLENGPFERIVRLFHTDLPDVRWNVRYFRILEKQELRVELDKAGKLIQWVHIKSAEAPGAILDRDEALRIARAELARVFGVDLSREKLVSENTAAQEHRRDYTFEFERTHWGWGAAKLRTSIGVEGDEPVNFQRYIKIPEAWVLLQEKSGWKKFITGELGTWLSYGEIALAMVLFVLLIRKHLVPWRYGFLLALIPAVLSLLMSLNRTEWFYSSYTTTTSLGAYLTIQWAGGAVALTARYLGQVLTISIALGFVRWAFGWRLEDLTLWPRSRRERAAFWTTTFVTAAAAYALLFALARLESLVNGFFLPDLVTDIYVPPVDSAYPWVQCVLAAIDSGFTLTVRLAAVWSVAALLYRRFPRLATLGILAFPLLEAAQQQNWTGFVCSALLGELQLAVILYLVWRVFRFNAAAIFLTYTLRYLVPLFVAYYEKGGPAYSRQALYLALALLAPLVAGVVAHTFYKEPAEAAAPAGT